MSEESREDGWEELRREIERLRVRELIGSVAAERLLAAAQEEPEPDVAAQAVVNAWDAMILAALDYGEQGPLYPDDTVGMADAIAALRAALATPTTPEPEGDKA